MCVGLKFHEIFKGHSLGNYDYIDSSTPKKYRLCINIIYRIPRKIKVFSIYLHLP